MDFVKRFYCNNYKKMKNPSKTDSPHGELSGYNSEVFRIVKQNFIRNKIVLDVGCGFGWAELFFSKLDPRK